MSLAEFCIAFYYAVALQCLCASGVLEGCTACRFYLSNNYRLKFDAVVHSAVQLHAVLLKRQQMFLCCPVNTTLRKTFLFQFLF